MEGSRGVGFGRLDGVMEHARRTAGQVPAGELGVEIVNLLFLDAAHMLLDEGMPSDEEQQRLRRYAAKREDEVTRRVGYVDKGKFKGVEGTEYDEEFGRAAEELLAFFSSPYFGHTSRDIIRNLAARRILEVTDDVYKKAFDVESAKKLQEMLALKDSGEPNTPEEIRENLQLLTRYQ